MNRCPSRSFLGARATLAVLVAALLAFGAGCTGTETDNPITGHGDGPFDPPPPYESPGEFTPNHSAPGCPPPRPTSRPSRLPHWGRDGSMLAGAEQDVGLRIVDVGDPRAPRVVGERVLAGDPRAVLVDPGPFVTVALDELPVLHDDHVHPPAELESVSRLVRFDARDPARIERVAAVEIEGELWTLFARGELIWVMSAAIADGKLSCDIPKYSCHYVQYERLIATAYRATASGLERVQRSELPMSLDAWTTPEGFASYAGSGDAEGTLHVQRFGADGLLGEAVALRMPLPIFESAPISLAGEQARVFLRDPRDGGTKLAIFDLASGAQLGELANAIGPQDARFVSHAVFGQSQGAMQMVDTSAPRSLRAVALGAPAMTMLSLNPEGTRLLAAGPDGQQSGPVVLTLLQAQGSALTSLASLRIDDWLSFPSANDFWLDSEGAHLLLSYLTFSGQRADVRASAVTIGEQTLTRVELPLAGRPRDVLFAGDALYALNPGGMTVASLTPSASPPVQLSWGDRVTESVRTADYEAALIEPGLMPPQLLITRGDQRTRLPVSPGAAHVHAAGDRVLVISPYPADQCEQTGWDCSGHAPNVEIFGFAGGDTPRSLARVALPDPQLNEQGDNASADLQWNDYPPYLLGERRLVFAAHFSASCTTEADCARLGIRDQPIGQAGVNQAPAACPPGTGATMCPSTPAATRYGSKEALRLYVLDLRGDEPSFGPAVESVLELGSSRFAEPQVSGDVLLVSRVERAASSPTPGQPSRPATARFMLDRFELDGAQLRALPALNVPGFALTLRGGDELLISAEPDAKQAGAGKLHLLALRDNGAHVLDSLPLAATYGQLAVRDDRAVYLRRSGEGCSGGTTLTAIELPARADATLRALGSVELPGLEWTVASWEDQRVLLQSEGLRYAVVELSDDGARVSSFETRASYHDHPQLNGEAIVGAETFIDVSHVVP